MSKFFTFLSLFITLNACQREDLIPKRDFVDILVKVYLTDASILATDLKTKLYYKDTIDYYSSAYKSFGYTRAQFDSTLVYYSRNPKEFDIIFDKVINELSKMETMLSDNLNTNQTKIDSTAVDSTTNLWNKKTFWQLPEDGKVEAVDFEIPVKGLGVYTLKASVQVFSDDQSLVPKITAFFYYDDKTQNGNRTQHQYKYYQKDDSQHSYEIRLELNNLNVTHIKGWILDHSNKDDNFAKHSSVSEISLTYKPFPKKATPIKPLRSLKKKNIKPE